MHPLHSCKDTFRSPTNHYCRLVKKNAVLISALMAILFHLCTSALVLSFHVLPSPSHRYHFNCMSSCVLLSPTTSLWQIHPKKNPSSSFQTQSVREVKIRHCLPLQTSTSVKSKSSQGSATAHLSTALEPHVT